MTWDDFVSPPGTFWANSSVRGSERNFNIALVLLDYPDEEFIILKCPDDTIFGNPQPGYLDLHLTREKVATYYRDLLNTPSEVNKGHTIHEYWMGDSFGRYGVDLTSFVPYQLPAKALRYGIDTNMNAGACPAANETCGLDLREAGYLKWRADVGNNTASSFEMVFFLSAGQDESST